MSKHGACLTRSYCLGRVASVKDRRLFNVLGTGARWCIFYGMSQNLSFCIEAVSCLVRLTAGIILAFGNPDATVPILNVYFR
jgi:hypothetical protein